MRILGVESSCDDTCAAVVEHGRRVLSSVISSQDEVHQRYGGIVPELASRRHLECILPVIEEALRQADCTLEQVDAIAVTYGPGLIGSLLVGLSAAKAMAYSTGLPLAPVHHLEGHLISPWLSDPQLPYPHLGLVVSGGHSALYRVVCPSGEGVRLIGQTRDDAAGEAFDKVGQKLGLPFPGGPHIERTAREDGGKLIPFPRPRFKTGGFQFSFSGLKTAAAQYIESERLAGRSLDVPKICRSFQEAVVDCLASETFRALKEEGLDAVAVSGGVAANGALRERFHQLAREQGARVFFAERKFCTDNAAMIAAVGYHKLKANGRPRPKEVLDLNAYAQLPLGRAQG
jgi:N6-L-threonylcarbamoyladenine synthase